MIVDWNGIVCALLFTLLFQAIRSFYVSFIARKLYRLLDQIFNFSSGKLLSKLTDELINLRKALKATSAMDEFSKWAKLNRLCNKKESEREELKQKVQLDLLKFMLSAKIVIYCVAAALELFYFFYNYSTILVNDVTLFFPLDAMVALPFNASACRCVSFWTIYIFLFLVVHKALSFHGKQQAPESLSPEPDADDALLDELAFPVNDRSSRPPLRAAVPDTDKDD